MDPKLVDRLTYLAVAVVALAAGYFFSGAKTPAQPAQAPAVAPQPQVQPTPAPCPGPFCPRPRCPGPSCPGDCIEHAVPASKPFTVTCPFCRNTLSVTQPVRPTGDVVDDTPAPVPK